LSLFGVYQRKKQKQIAILLWDWWTVRNKVNAGEREKPAHEVCSLIQRHCLDFNVHLAQSSSLDDLAGNQNLIEKQFWKRPEGEMVKINFDTAFNEKTRKGAWGFVVRISSGDFMAAGARKLTHLRDALQAETEACVAAKFGHI
jgi:hypothetical protein